METCNAGYISQFSLDLSQRTSTPRPGEVRGGSEVSGEQPASAQVGSGAVARRPAPSITPEEAARFWERLGRGDGCWEWPGARNKRGYGKVYLREGAPFGTYGRMHYAHRVAFLLTTGLWPRGVLHKCDNPSCARPDHLFPGNQAINMVDCREKGRLRAKGHAYSETHCSRGHEWNEANTWRESSGARHCRACRHDRERRTA